MRAVRIVGLIMMAIGAIWFLQGIGMLGGSFMTGQSRWTVIGAITAVLGLLLTVVSGRQPRR
jgi:hypothetical protein